ncbi:MAG TPA: hypothetical protein ENH94_02335 [Phycisphaerales bacterium]|nr:hypothetical protein [Phycisphaerales bacterium]
MSGSNNAYVIHRHDSGGETHWDLMLESADSLRTWRLDTHPQDIRSQPVSATSIAAHAKRFLTYEGPVQNARGNVQIVDSGTYACPDNSSTQLKLTLAGRILKGTFTLTHICDDNWQFTRTGKNENPIS